MKISKLGTALAFCLAMSAGQAHAEPVSVTVINDSSSMAAMPNGGQIARLEFVPSGQKFKGGSNIPIPIPFGKTGIATVNKLPGECVFDYKATWTAPTVRPVSASIDLCKTRTLTIR